MFKCLTKCSYVMISIKNKNSKLLAFKMIIWVCVVLKDWGFRDLPHQQIIKY